MEAATVKGVRLSDGLGDYVSATLLDRPNKRHGVEHERPEPQAVPSGNLTPQVRIGAGPNTKIAR